MPNKMTLTTAREYLADCLAKECLGDGDAEALRLVLATLDARTAALAGLVGPASQAEDDLGSLLDAGALADNEERANEVHANLDDLAAKIGKADAALSE